MKLKLDRPLAFFDIESTGTNRKADRIIDLAIAILHPDGRRDTHTFRVNPGVPIPEGATAVHGIHDDDVKDCPRFEAMAAEVMEVFEGCDLAGFNILGFDIPLLEEEFARAGLKFETEDRKVIDAQRIYHQKEPRTLTAALQFYCGEMHLDAHGALGDVDATVRVLEGQFERYDDLPTDSASLHEFCNPRNPEWVDRTGKLKWEGDEVLINFGKNAGRKLRDMARLERSFLEWILAKDFPRDTQEIVQKALAGEFPERERSQA